MSQVPDNFCSHCLPDCDFTVYKPKIILQAFTTCNAQNIGVNRLCTLDMNKRSMLQTKFVNQILQEYTLPNGSYSEIPPPYIQALRLASTFHDDQAGDIFKQNVAYSYDFFARDVAMVQIIYEKSTSIQMKSQVTMTWIDYFATVGGLLGLVLGMGFVSFIELFWLSFEILSRLNYQRKTDQDKAEDISKN